VRLVWGTVASIASQRAGLQRLFVEPDGAAAAPAVSYTSLSGECAPGDRVLLNTTAVDLALGTGGSHLVVARLSADDDAGTGVALDDPSGGHIMKLRYTPLQRDVLAVESPESPAHEALRNAVDVGGMPVVCCGLHSQVVVVAAAIRERKPDARIAYVMTDEAALPIALSELVAGCVDAGLLDLTVTCGQSFGGMLEAVTLHSGLLAARVAGHADVAIVAIGPGVVGTGTAMGHGGIAQGEAVNAAAAVGGRPVATLRVSFADARERHQGVSHHTLTALGRIALAPAMVAVPALGPSLNARVDADLAEAGVWARHTRADAAVTLPGLRGVPARSMGRGPDDDPAFFLAAAAAGAVAATLL
jgi:hypothetical protein